MLTPSTPCDCGAVGALRIATSMVPHSTTSKSMSMPTALKFCCMNSFIGIGTICPDPEVEIMIFALHRLSGAVAGFLQEGLRLVGIVFVSVLWLAEHWILG